MKKKKYIISFGEFIRERQLQNAGVDLGIKNGVLNVKFSYCNEHEWNSPLKTNLQGALMY